MESPSWREIQTEFSLGFVKRGGVLLIPADDMRSRATQFRIRSTVCLRRSAYPIGNRASCVIHLSSFGMTFDSPQRSSGSCRTMGALAGSARSGPRAALLLRGLGAIESRASLELSDG